MARLGKACKLGVPRRRAMSARNISFRCGASVTVPQRRRRRTRTACTSGCAGRVIGRVQRRILTAVQVRKSSMMGVVGSGTRKWKESHRLHHAEGRQNLMDVAGQLGVCSGRARLELPLPCSRQYFLAPSWGRRPRRLAHAGLGMMPLQSNATMGWQHLPTNSDVTVTVNASADDFLGWWC